MKTSKGNLQTDSQSPPNASDTPSQKNKERLNDSKSSQQTSLNSSSLFRLFNPRKAHRGLTLSERVSGFFLIALAIALIGYSAVLYIAVSRYIHFQFESEVQGVMGSLVAAVEVEETEVKWQPLEHSIDDGNDKEFGAVQWIVYGDSKIIEQSNTLDPALLQASSNLVASQFDHSSPIHPERNVGNLYLAHVRLAAPSPTQDARESDEFDEIVVVVGRPTTELRNVLNKSIVLLVTIPLIIWILATLTGRWFVRKALSPLTAMARQVHSIDGDKFNDRLDYKETGDELTELGRSFNRLLERQQIAFEQQQRFAGDAAHELRTPLTVLLGELDVTLRRERTQAEYAETLVKLRHQAISLQEIVESLLFLARSDHEQSHLQLHSVPIHKWLESKKEEWTSDNDKNRIVLNNQLDNTITVKATYALLNRIVDNLVSNALKYSPGNTSVSVNAYSLDQQVVIEVSDQGIGIDPNEIPSLFTPFFRSSEARKRGLPGVGLGLAIANRIARFLGASLDCNSSKSLGTTFRFVVPIERTRGEQPVDLIGF